jgi:hypothetical protein
VKSQSPIMGASWRPHIDRSPFRGDSGASTSYLRCLKTVCKPEYCEPWTSTYYPRSKVSKGLKHVYNRGSCKIWDGILRGRANKNSETCIPRTSRLISSYSPPASLHLRYRALQNVTTIMISEGDAPKLISMS